MITEIKALEIFEAWLDLMESGEVRKAYFYHRVSGPTDSDLCMCATGVLLHVIDPNAWAPCGLSRFWAWRDTVGYVFSIAEEYYLDPYMLSYVQKLNDNTNMSLPEIALRIRRHFRKAKIIDGVDADNMTQKLIVPECVHSLPQRLAFYDVR
jgi:hypothetical protein